jgi:hypothetical protein
MESPHGQDSRAEERTSPKGETYDRESLLDLVRSIVRHPAVKDAAVEMVRDGLTEPAEAQMREGVRAGASEALARLSDRLGEGIDDALDALTEEDWTLIARELLEDAQEVSEAAA